MECYVQVRVLPISSNQFLEQTTKLTATEFELIFWRRLKTSRFATVLVDIIGIWLCRSQFSQLVAPVNHWMFNPCNLIKVLQFINFCFWNLESWALKLGRESKIPNVQRSIQNTKTFWIIPYVHGASEDPSVIIKRKGEINTFSLGLIIYIKRTSNNQSYLTLRR